VDEMRRLGFADGLRELQLHLGKIILPPDCRQWPDVACIRQANRFRGIELGK
jgi:hypothetical protein